MPMSKCLSANMVLFLCRCIFVWRLPPEVTEHMHSRLVELGKKVTLDTPRQEDFDR